MEHATWNEMKRNKTKTEKLTQPVRSVHKAQRCRCRCLCLCCRLCRRAQTKNAAASSEVERAKSSWVSHTSTACLMRNKMAMEHFCVNIHKHTYMFVHTVHVHDTYIHAYKQICKCMERIVHRPEATALPAMRLTSDNLLQAFTHTCTHRVWQRHATRQSYKSTRSSHILHTYVCIL